MPKSTFCFVCTTVLLGLFTVTLFDAKWRTHNAFDDISRRRSLVRELAITDLSLFTEARYTRHLSQADRHTPFQDHPMALEHFPSGSLTLPNNGGTPP